MSKTARNIASLAFPILHKKTLIAAVVTAAAVISGNPYLIKAALAYDASVVAGMLAPRPPTMAGNETRWKADPQAGVPYAVGRCAVAGDIRFERSAPVSGSNKFKNFVTVYSVGPIEGFEEFYANSVVVPFTADSGEGASGYYQNRMWMVRQLGGAHAAYLHWTATGTKDTPANHGGMPDGWTSAHKLSGYAASLWGLEWDTAKYAGGVPPPKQVGKWVRCYDPRKDSTYPGGAGSHRYANPGDKAAYLAAKATWSWTADPFLHGLQWALGAWTGDPDLTGEPLVQTHGFGLDIEDVDVAAFVEAANVAYANGWTLGGQVYSTDDKWEVLRAFLQCGAGEPILLGDKLSCLVNAPKVSVATLTGADAAGEVSLDAAVPYNERLNTIWPSWTVEELAWEVTPAAAPVQVAAYVDVDRGVRSRELPLPMVQSAVQAGQLSRYLIEDSRELTNIVIQAKPAWMWLEPGQCFTANEPAWGLNGQKLLILKRVRDPATMKVTLVCRTETDGKHAWALGQTATAPDTPALTGVDANIVPLPAADAWAVVGGEVAGATGSLPGIVITGEVDLYDAVSIVVDYREVLATVPVTYGDWKSESFPASATTLVVSGVKPGATYQVRVRYITAKGVENPDSNVDLGEVAVGGVDAGTVQGRDVVANIAEANARINEALDSVDEALDDAAAASSSASAASAAAASALSGLSAEVTRAIGAEGSLTASIVSLTSTVGGNTSAISAEAVTRAAADSALSASLTSLTSTVGGNTSAISAEAVTRAAADSALSASLTSLTSTVGGNTSSISAEAVTRAAADSALSASLTSLTATSTGGGINANPMFAGYPTTPGIPTGWADFASGAIGTRVTGEAGSFGYRVVAPGSGSQGLVQNLYLSTGWYVIEASYYIESGNGNGAGILVNGQTYGQNSILSFAIDPDINEATGAGGGGIRRFAKLIQRTGSETCGFVMATNWNAIGTVSAKTLTWYRASIRPATEGEIKGRRADANATTALAQITSNAAAQASINSAQATTNATLTSTVGGNTSSISAEAVTRAAADSALSASLTTLTAMSTGGINANPMFAGYPATPGIPTGWSDFASGAIGARVTGEAGSFGYRVVAPGSGSQGLVQNLYLSTGWYVIEASYYIESGNGNGAGILVNGQTSGQNNILSFATDPDINEATGAGGGGIRRFAKLIQRTGSETCGFVMATNWNAIGTVSAKTLTWYRASIRPATEGEIKGRRADANATTALGQITANAAAQASINSAQATTNSGTSASIGGLNATTSAQAVSIADAATKLAVARLTFQTAAGSGRPARFGLYSDSYGGSAVALDADQIYFGDNTIFDDATDTLRTVTGSTARVIAWGAAFGTSSDLLEWIGPSSTAMASMTKANAHFFTSPTAPYIGGAAVAAVTTTPASGTWSDSVPTAGTTETTVLSFAAPSNFPSGGKFKITAALGAGVSGGAAPPTFDLKIKIQYGATVTTLAAVESSITAVGAVSDAALRALASILITNPSSGAATILVTRQRTSAGTTSTASYNGAVLVEWINA